MPACEPLKTIGLGVRGGPLPSRQGGHIRSCCLLQRRSRSGQPNSPRMQPPSRTWHEVQQVALAIKRYALWAQGVIHAPSELALGSLCYKDGVATRWTLGAQTSGSLHPPQAWPRACCWWSH